MISKHLLRCDERYMYNIGIWYVLSYMDTNTLNKIFIEPDTNTDTLKNTYTKTNTD